MMKIERGMKTGKRNGLTAAATVAAILAVVTFAAPKDVMAGMELFTVTAPKETKSIHLDAKDPSASVRLQGWWCSKNDLKEFEPREFREWKFRMGNIDELLHEASKDMATMPKTGEEKALNLYHGLKNVDWPYSLFDDDQKSPRYKVDVPPGETKVYTFKYCYTKEELDTMHDKVFEFLRAILGK